MKKIIKRIKVLGSFNDLFNYYLLALLLLTDIAFIGVHILHIYASFPSSFMYNIEIDGSYAELFQYIKFFWIILIATWLGFSQDRSYVAWVIFFGYLLADDKLSLHETMGEVWASHLNLSTWMRLRAIDYGELLNALMIGALLGTSMLLAYRYGSRSFRLFSQNMFKLILGLVFFGVGVDMLHVIATGTPFFNLFGILEDGGEMIVTSFMVSYVFAQFSLDGALRHKLSSQ